MIKILLRIAVITAALLAITHANLGISISDWQTAVIVAVVWAIISVTLKPMLELLTFPITIISFGLFSFILNAVLFWLIASLVPGFYVSGFIAALVGSALLSLAVWLSHRLF